MHQIGVLQSLTQFIGFGRRMSFTEELEVPPGFTMNFKDALRIVSEGVIVKLAVPKRALGLTQRFREIDCAFDELEVMFILHGAQRRQFTLIDTSSNSGT